MAKRKNPDLSPALRRAEAVLERSNTPARVEAASYVAGEFAGGRMTARESGIALGILELMVRDVEKDVRVAVAEHVKSCPHLPPETARTLAADIEEVALPVIRYSSVLGEADFLEIIASGNLAKQVAIAGRDTVPEAVSHALVETGSETVVGTLLANAGAEIGEASYGRIIDLFPDNGRIHELMADRPVLPLSAVERLVSCVAVELRERILARHRISRDLADSLVRHGSEDALTRSVSRTQDATEIAGLAGRLLSKDQLTPSLVLRALAHGEIALFESAMAALAGLSVENTQTFLYERGAGGVRMVFRNTSLPQPMFRAIRIAVEAVADLHKKGKGRTPDARALSRHVVERWLASYDSLTPGSAEAVLGQLVDRLLDSHTASASAA